MINSIFIVVFSLVSLIGSAAYYVKHKQISIKKHLSLLFFTVSHTIFFLIGLYSFFHTAPFVWLISCIIVIFLSRIINGRILFEKNDLRHYIVNSGIMLVIILLYAYQM